MTVIQDAVQASAVGLRPVAGHIGADITDVDISRPLAPEQVSAIRDVLYRYKVIFFRGRHLDHASQIAFGRQFGELTYAHPHDDAPPEDYPEIFTVDPDRYEQRYGEEFRAENRRRQYSYFTGWHTDVTAAVNPPAGSILRAEVVPQIGGDTTWLHLDLPRTLHRVTLVGDVPVGTDGRESELVAGKPFTSKHTVVVAD